MTTTAPAPPQKASSRRRLLIIGCLVLLAVVCIGAGAMAAYSFVWSRIGSAPEPTVAYILDTSPRMSQSSEGDTRLAIAQAILAEIVRPADPTYTTGLRVFGSGVEPQSCEDTELVVPFAPANQSAIADRLLGLQVGSSAESALAEAMLAAVRDLDRARGPHYLVVVTGGADSCNPQAGELIASEAERAGISLETYVVGYQVTPEDAVALKTMAEVATGATYYDAPNAAALRAALTSIRQRIEQPAAAASPGGYDAQTACDHPYFPLRAGATWSYASEGYSFTWTIPSVTGDLSSATASILMSFEGGSTTFEWTCTSEGVFAYDVGSFTADTLGTFANFRVTGQTGARFPSAEQLESAASWSSEYTQEFETSVEGLSLVTTTQVQENHSAGALTTYAISLGSFEAIPISTISNSTTSSTFGTFSSTYASVCWFARGIGMLACDSDSEGFSSRTELTAYTVP